MSDLLNHPKPPEKRLRSLTRTRRSQTRFRQVCLARDSGVRSPLRSKEAGFCISAGIFDELGQGGSWILLRQLTP